MASDVGRIYATSQGDPDFASVLHEARITGEKPLADIIEHDGRLRLRKGMPVDLKRYLAAVPDLASDVDALDAAIDVSLRGLAGSSRITPEAVEQLSQRHPAFAVTIRETASLNAALWSTSGLKRRVVPGAVRQLPCDFGPRLPSGQPRYLLDELLGQGSFGQVYKATDRHLSEDDGAGHRAIVAIKVLSDATRTPLDRHRLIDEAAKVRRISHPNVVQVLDRGVSEEDEDFIVYEHIDGGDLGDLRQDQLPMEPHVAATLMAKIARGVHAAHSAGVIHCDLKPSNVMRTAAGEPKVADFGIAIRLDDHGGSTESRGSEGRGPVGNIAFISPEQFRGEDAALSVPSDVYALGGMLFHLLTGRLPNGSSRPEIATTHSRDQGRVTPPSPALITHGIDNDLDAICQRALRSRPEERYPSAAAFAEDLERWLALEPIPFTMPSAVRKLHLWARRSPALALASVVIVFLIIAGIGVAAHFASVANQRRMEAAIAAMEVKKKQEMEEFKARLFAGTKAALSNIADRGRFVGDMLLVVWALEYFYGPKMLDSPEHLNEVWGRRSQAIRSIIGEYRDAGRGDTMETLLLEQLLAFWLVNQGDYEEAIPLLDHGFAVWQQHWPNDPWLNDTRAIRACADVNRLRAELDADVVGVTAAAVMMHPSLSADATRLDAERPRSPLHYLVLNRLADLEDMLGRPTEANEIRARVKVLLDETQLKAAGVTGAAQSQKTSRP